MFFIAKRKKFSGSRFLSLSLSHSTSLNAINMFGRNHTERFFTTKIVDKNYPRTHILPVCTLRFLCIKNVHTREDLFIPLHS